MPNRIHSQKKRPRSFSLASDVVDVVDAYRKGRRLDSLTSALEEIVREWKTARVAQEVTSYYDAMAEPDAAEDELWGKFSESEM